MISLDDTESTARQILVAVASRKAPTKRDGLISYKELWQLISEQQWGQARTSKLVSVITKVSAYELERRRPPLNELVVQTQKREPREEWRSIRDYLRKIWNVIAPYTNHAEAQRACWEYWSSASDAADVAHTVMPDDDRADEAEEGFRQDRTTVFRSRNAVLIAKRKSKDNYTCQSCGFHLQVEGGYVIDCHHTNPLGLADAPVLTKIDELVCLCPTCHRIAHTRRNPLSIAEIKRLRTRLG